MTICDCIRAIMPLIGAWLVLIGALFTWAAILASGRSIRIGVRNPVCVAAIIIGVFAIVCGMRLITISGGLR